MKKKTNFISDNSIYIKIINKLQIEYLQDLIVSEF